MLQTIIVTLVAASALGVIVRRYSSTWLPAAFRPVRRQEGCDSCPLMTDDGVGRAPDSRTASAGNRSA